MKTQANPPKQTLRQLVAQEKTLTNKANKQVYHLGIELHGCGGSVVLSFKTQQECIKYISNYIEKCLSARKIIPGSMQNLCLYYSYNDVGKAINMFNALPENKATDTCLRLCLNLL